MITSILSFPFMFLSPHVGYTPKTEALSYLSLRVRVWYCASDPSEDSAVCCKWIYEVNRPVAEPEDHPFLWSLLPTMKTGVLNRQDEQAEDARDLQGGVIIASVWKSMGWWPVCPAGSSEKNLWMGLTLVPCQQSLSQESRLSWKPEVSFAVFL